MPSTKPRVTPTKPVAAVATIPEQQDTHQDLTAVSAWFKALPQFFARAAEIEASARNFHEAALTRAVPTSLEEDKAIVADVRTARERKKEAEDYWSVAGLLSRLHRRVTAARARAVDPLDQAIARLSSLHTTYERLERERVAREAEEARRAEEAKAAAERAKELAALEAAAVAAEESSPDLSERERAFVDYMAEREDFPGVAIEAAKRAGFQNPQAQAARLMGSAKVQAAIQARKDAKAARLQAEAIAAAPVQAAYVAPPPVQVAKGTRTTRGAECFDQKAFIAACLSGKVPEVVALAVLRVDGPALNDQGKAFREAINQWPGVRYVENGTVV